MFKKIKIYMQYSTFAFIFLVNYIYSLKMHLLTTDEQAPNQASGTQRQGLQARQEGRWRRQHQVTLCSPACDASARGHTDSAENMRGCRVTIHLSLGA